MSSNSQTATSVPSITTSMAPAPLALDKKAIAASTGDKEVAAAPYSDEKIFYDPPSSAALAAWKSDTQGPALKLPNAAMVSPESVYSSTATPMPSAAVCTPPPVYAATNTVPNPTPGLEVAQNSAPAADLEVVPGSGPMQRSGPVGPVQSSGAVHEEIFSTVTPLHLLRDQSDTVDCPFCRKQVQTVVKKTPSKKTHVTAVICFFTTGPGAAVPYCLEYKYNFDHHCSNCDKRVARKTFKEEEARVYGTPEHLRLPSKYPAAPVKSERTSMETRTTQN